MAVPSIPKLDDAVERRYGTGIIKLVNNLLREKPNIVRAPDPGSRPGKAMGVLVAEPSEQKGGL